MSSVVSAPMEVVLKIGQKLRLCGVNHKMIFWKEILMKRHSLVFIAMLASLSLLITFSFYEVTYDDVYLAFRYARNLTEGYGFVFNPGENFLGTPAPFFVVSLALLRKLLPMLSIPQIASWISGFSLFFCSLFTFLIARDSHQSLVGFLVALFTLFNPLVLMTFGGETPLYLMLVCAAFYFYFKGQMYIPSFLLALSLLNRSEGIVPTAVIFGHFLLVKRRVPLGPVALYLLTITPWLAFSFVKFGSPLTNSLAAKIAQVEVGLQLFLRGAIDWMQLIIGGNLFFAAFIPLFVLGMIYAVVGERQWLLVFSWVILQTIGYVILRVPFYHWYIAHVGLGLGILASLGAASLPYFWGSIYKVVDDLLVALKEDAVALRHKLSSFRDKLKVLYPLCVSLVGLCVILSLLAEIRAIYPYYRGKPGPANRLYQAAGKWFAENTDQDASIAYLEIGQIGYYSDRRIIDVLGLVTPGVVDHVKKGDFLWAYLRYKPDYIVYNSIFSPWIEVVRQQPWFKDSYCEVASLQEPGYPAPLVIYRKKAGAFLDVSILDYPLRSWTVQHPLHLNLDGQIELLGYDLSTDQVRPGDTLELTLYWHALTELEEDYTIFTHLLGESYNPASGSFLWGQKDNMPLDGSYPTSRWLENEAVVDRYAIAVQPDAPPGLYRIEVGMYLLETGQRLPVFDDQGQRIPEDRVLLEQTIEVATAK